MATLVFLTAFLQAPPDAKLTRFTFTEPHMGTRFKIVLYGSDQKTAERAAQSAFKRIADLDQIMSDYRPDSEIMRLCRRASGESVTVSGELFFVLNKAQEISRLSDGAFDITVGPLSLLWRNARRTHVLPDPAELAKARTLVGYQYVHLDAARKTVRLDKKGMRLDLGGIAKGYAGDEALAVLGRLGYRRALVAAGGDIVVGDPPPNRPGWSVALATLENPAGKPGRILTLKNAAVSTSGDSEQYLEVGGKRFSHILDPRTGQGLTQRRSATVVAEKGIDADGLTKVVIILGSERGFAALAHVRGTAALLVEETKAGLRVVSTRSFDPLSRPEKSSTSDLE